MQLISNQTLQIQSIAKYIPQPQPKISHSESSWMNSWKKGTYVLQNPLTPRHSFSSKRMTVNSVLYRTIDDLINILFETNTLYHSYQTSSHKHRMRMSLQNSTFNRVTIMCESRKAMSIRQRSRPNLVFLNRS